MRLFIIIGLLFVSFVVNAQQKDILTTSAKGLKVLGDSLHFLRQGDHLEFTAQILNLSGKELTGQAQLALIDAATGQSVDGWFQNVFPNQYFTVAAGQSEVVKFPMEVPYKFTSTLKWRVVASAEDFSDGAESLMPVLSNKVLVTETLPLSMTGTGSKRFSFSKLAASAGSESLQHKSLTVEYTSNSAWLAMQALPYLMESPYECAEQTWNRFYAIAIGIHLLGSSPRIKAVLDSWKTQDTSALLPAVQKNEELKSALLAETPWAFQATSESQQKVQIVQLLDMARMSKELSANLEKLKAMQSSNGGFAWFKGGPDDRYITQYILTGIGHLQRLGAVPPEMAAGLQPIITAALSYLDKRMVEDYATLLKTKANLTQKNSSYIQQQYLYMRSFFPQQNLSKNAKTASDYYRLHAQRYWMTGNKYAQGMIALALSRTGDKITPAAILKSLKATAVNSPELGMYWQDNSFGKSWFWHAAPIETQALLIEAFSEVGKDAKTVNALRAWLVTNKQTTNWRTTKATADACYALLLEGTDWLTTTPEVSIKLGNTSIANTSQTNEADYFKKTIEGSKVTPDMGNIVVTTSQPINQSTNQPLSPLYGAVYWQYFEDMDKVTTAATPLKISKKLFITTNTDRGPVLSVIEENKVLHVGDKITVRIELRANRDMEYMHMKDFRPSSLEPVNMLSGYRWQGSLGYFEMTRDASTSFFFNNLRKGTYVFEYTLFVTHTGSFSNGITTIQCMYAPEFNAHSEGVKITVE